MMSGKVQHSNHAKGGSPIGVAQQATNAVLRRRFVDGVGRWMVIALLIAVGGIGVSKLIGWSMGSRWWWGWIVLATGFALVMAMIGALRDRMTPAQGGGMLDDRLGFQSQIRSAIELDGDKEARAQSPGFVTIAQANASRLAGYVKVSQAMPMMDYTNWKRASGLLVLAIGLGIWAPMLEWGTPSPLQTVPSSAIAKIDAVSQSLDALDEGEEKSEEVQKAVEELEALREELANGVEDQSQANARAAAKLDEIADDLDERAASDREQAQELSDRLAQAQNQLAEEEKDNNIWNQQLDEFSQSIEDQRYDDASEQFNELKEQLDGLSDEDRQALSDQLEELANAVEPDRTERDPAKDLADSIREEAKDIREQKKSTQEETKTENQSSEERESQKTEEQSDPDQRDGEKGTEQNQSESQETSEQGDSESQKDKDNESGEKKQADGDGNEEGTEQRVQADGDDKGDQRQSEGEKEGDSQSGDQKQKRSVQEVLDEMQRRKGQSRKAQEQSENIREQVRELMDSEQMPEDQEKTGQQGVDSQQTQDENAGNKGDEPRVKENQRTPENAVDGQEYVTVDGSDPESNESGDPVGQWYAPDGETGTQSQAGNTVQRLRNASQRAQRAVDEQQVPRKYRQLVRDTFKRVNERADAIESGGKIAPQGKDAISDAQPAQQQSTKQTDSKE